METVLVIQHPEYVMSSHNSNLLITVDGLTGVVGRLFDWRFYSR